MAMQASEKKKQLMGRRKIVTVAVVLVLILLGVWFGVHPPQQQPNKIKIGVAQIVSHPSLDAVRDGFVAGMKEAGYKDGDNIVYDFQNAQGQPSVAASIAQKFVAEKFDLIVPITTGMTQAVVNAAKDTTIPIVFGAVTDPVGAGIVKSLDHPGGQVTGTSDIFPIREQLLLFKKIMPSMKTIGVVYNPGESGSMLMMNIIQKESKDLGLTVITTSVSVSSEVLGATQSLADKKVDALYTAGDSTVTPALESMIKVARDRKIPLFVGDIDSVERGGIASIGVNYSTVGKLTAQIAVEVLKGTRPGDIPVKIVTTGDMVLNLKAAQDMGITIPEDVVSQANRIIK